jgi:hypothetical protein
LATLDVRLNEEKSRIVDLSRGESFGFLGFDFRRVRSELSRSLLNLAECDGSASYLPCTATRGDTDIAAPREKIDPEAFVAPRFRRR